MPENEEEGINQKSAVVYGAIFSMIIAILSFLAIGWLLDKWLHTGPWLLVAGIVLGSAAGFYQFIRVLSRLS